MRLSPFLGSEMSLSTCHSVSILILRLLRSRSFDKNNAPSLVRALIFFKTILWFHIYFPINSNFEYNSWIVKSPSGTGEFLPLWCEVETLLFLLIGNDEAQTWQQQWFIVYLLFIKSSTRGKLSIFVNWKSKVYK